MSTPQPPRSPGAAASGRSEPPEDDSPVDLAALAVHQARARRARDHLRGRVHRPEQRPDQDRLRLRRHERAPDLGVAAACSRSGSCSACCSRSYTATGGVRSSASAPASRPTPARISSGETKLKASRADDSPPSARVEVAALHERHATLGRRVEQRTGVRAVREVHPGEVAALGPAPRRALGKLLLERLEHRVAPLPEQADDALDVRLEPPAADELVHGRLREQRRRQVGLDGEPLEPSDQLGRPDQVADPQARRGDLRERERVDDALALGELVDRSAGARPRSGRASTDRPRRRAACRRGRARRSLGGARARASARSGSGRSGSCTGTRRAARSRRGRGRRRPSAAGPARPRAARRCAACGRRSAPRRGCASPGRAAARRGARGPGASRS